MAVINLKHFLKKRREKMRLQELERMLTTLELAVIEVAFEEIEIHGDNTRASEKLLNALKINQAIKY